MKLDVLKVNAFTESLTGGNPAGVVLDTPDLSDEQMTWVSKELLVSETAFVSPGNSADYMVRFFSPEVEVDLCGHATIATFYTMAAKKLISAENKTRTVTQQTKAGIFPVHVTFTDKDHVDQVMMTQETPVFKPVNLEWSDIAHALHIQRDDIDISIPKQMVSTGLFTLPVCITSFAVLKTLKPDFQKIKQICTKIHVGSFHLFTFDTIEPTSVYHARNFAPLYGINEDPVTGTANGAVSSYLLKHGLIRETRLTCEQGDIMGRPGRVVVELDNNQVRVGGKARIAEEQTIEL